MNVTKPKMRLIFYFADGSVHAVEHRQIRRIGPHWEFNLAARDAPVTVKRIIQVWADGTHTTLLMRKPVTLLPGTQLHVKGTGWRKWPKGKMVQFRKDKHYSVSSL